MLFLLKKYGLPLVFYSDVCYNIVCYYVLKRLARTRVEPREVAP